MSDITYLRKFTTADHANTNYFLLRASVHGVLETVAVIAKNIQMGLCIVGVNGLAITLAVCPIRV